MYLNGPNLVTLKFFKSFFSFLNKKGNIVQGNIKALLCNHWGSGKSISTTYSGCVFIDLGIQHAMRMSHIVLSSVACPALQYFSTLPHKRRNLKTNLLNIKCVFLFYLQILFEIFHILRRAEEIRTIIIFVFMYSIHYSCKILVKLDISLQIFEK